MRNTRRGSISKTWLVIIAGSMLVAACSGSSDADGADAPASTASPTTAASTPVTTAEVATTTTTERVSPPSTDAVGRPCDGGAFPSDEEFRFLVCDVQYLQLDVTAAGHETDPQWISRASRAILTYDVDRANSIVELEALISDLEAVLAG